MKLVMWDVRHYVDGKGQRRWGLVVDALTLDGPRKSIVLKKCAAGLGLGTEVGDCQRILAFDFNYAIVFCPSDITSDVHLPQRLIILSFLTSFFN